MFCLLATCVNSQPLFLFYLRFTYRFLFTFSFADLLVLLSSWTQLHNVVFSQTEVTPRPRVSSDSVFAHRALKLRICWTWLSFVWLLLICGASLANPTLRSHESTMQLFESLLGTANRVYPMRSNWETDLATNKYESNDLAFTSPWQAVLLNLIILRNIITAYRSGFISGSGLNPLCFACHSEVMQWTYNELNRWALNLVVSNVFHMRMDGCYCPGSTTGFSHIPAFVSWAYPVLSRPVTLLMIQMKSFSDKFLPPPLKWIGQVCLHVFSFGSDY